MRQIIYAIAILSGTIIGVGLFSLPYITSKVGILVMLGYFLVLGFFVIILHLFFGELSLHTPDFKRLPGFAKFHLGNWGQIIAYISTILGLSGAILAYLIVGGEFLGNLLLPLLGGSPIIYTLLYFAAGAILIFFGIKIIAKIELWGLILFILVLITIFFRSQPFFKAENLLFTSNLNSLFLPYGAVLFSLWGATLIPEVEEMLREKRGLLKKIIPIAILIPILVYLFFVYLILGVTGPKTTESALLGLRNVLTNEIVSLGLLFGVLTTFTSFIALGLTLKKIFWYDLKIEKNLSWAITCFPALILFLIGVKGFISVISLVGGVMLGIDAILIILMYQAYKKMKRLSLSYLFTSFLILIFSLGVLYEIIYFIKG